MAPCGWRNTAGHWPPIGNGGTLRDAQAATWDTNCVNTLLEWKIPYASNCSLFCFGQLTVRQDFISLSAFSWFQGCEPPRL